MEEDGDMKNRWGIFSAIVLLSFMSTLTSSIVNIALPVMSRDLNVPIAQITWVASSYLVVTCMLLLPFGKLGDLFGKINVFKIGTVVFTISSLLCGINFGFAWVLLMRAIQAIGASMTLSTNAGIITETFSKKQRGLALGSFGSVVALGAIAGPGIGGLILTYLPWHYIFWVNVPIGLAAILLGKFVLPKDVHFQKAKVDVWGLLVLIVMMGSFFLALIIGQEAGFLTMPFIGLTVVFIIALIGFIWIEKRVVNPAVNFKLFAKSDLTMNLMATVLVYGISFIVNIIEPIYLEQNRKLPTNITGFILISFPIIQIVVSPIAGLLSDKLGAHFIVLVALALMVVSQFGLASVHHATSLILLCLWLGFVGLGNGLFQAPTNVLIMNSVSKNQLGVASGLLGLSRNTGMTIGSIFANILLFLGIDRALGEITKNYPFQQPTAFISGMQFVFLVTAVVLSLFFIIQLGVIFKQKNNQQKES